MCFTFPFKLARFENEEDEESYKRLRDRERRQVYLHDYVEEYRFTTDYGDLILQQRSFMIRWIVEVSHFFWLIFLNTFENKLESKQRSTFRCSLH